MVSGALRTQDEVNANTQVPRMERKIHMMSKRSSRVIAWLLALVMILNISPLSVLAEVIPQQDPENDITMTLDTGLDAHVLEVLSTGSALNETRTYTVQYVIKGEYTYTGENLILDEYTRTVTNGNPSSEQPGSITGCSLDFNNKSWDEATNTLTFYAVPDTNTIELRYMLILKTNKSMLRSEHSRRCRTVKQVCCSIMKQMTRTRWM